MRRSAADPPLAVDWVWDHSRAQGVDKLVLLYIARRADHKTGADAFPALATIADGTGLGQRTVRDALERLQASGEIEVQLRRDSRGRRTSSLYRLVMSPREQAGIAKRWHESRKPKAPRYRQESFQQVAAAATCVPVTPFPAEPTPVAAAACGSNAPPVAAAAMSQWRLPHETSGGCRPSTIGLPYPVYQEGVTEVTPDARALVREAGGDFRPVLVSDETQDEAAQDCHSQPPTITADTASCLASYRQGGLTRAASPPEDDDFLPQDGEPPTWTDVFIGAYQETHGGKAPVGMIFAEVISYADVAQRSGVDPADVRTAVETCARQNGTKQWQFIAALAAAQGGEAPQRAAPVDPHTARLDALKRRHAENLARAAATRATGTPQRVAGGTT